jgi:type II secretory pathway component PulJ
MDKLRQIIHNKNGASLVEMLVAMPLLCFLLLTIGAAFLLLMKFYSVYLGDLELQQQMRFAVLSMTRDIAAAKAVKISSDKLEITTERHLEQEKKILYELNTGQTISRLMKENQPLTGESRVAAISITKFNCKKVKNHIINIEIEGINQNTDKKISLETAVVMLANGS